MALEVCPQCLYSRAVWVYTVRMGCGYFSVGGRLSGCSPTIHTFFFFLVVCVCVSTYTQRSLRPQNPASVLFKPRWQVLPPNLSLNFVSMELYSECSRVNGFLFNTVMMCSHTWLLLVMTASLLLTPSASVKMSTTTHSFIMAAGRQTWCLAKSL